MADKLKPTDIDIENMTTPTKEQIKELCLHLCFNCENDFPCDGHCYKCESEHWKKYKWQVRETVKLWEKIRNSTKQGNIWEEQMSAFLETVFFCLMCLVTGFFFRLGQETANKICPPKGKNK